ncbi:MAG TPA: Fe-S protein assembly co-chaperone HscB [Chitinophagales bacterium]|nr:Fe-S protein assembly co-chaperone HscB [Chitinophagales bacterium]HMZ88847.1 Fe-S protein assembly co-chaperone HscB [Chitinophagales bacterium]HNI53804.1 Fe-S protein assembly co-chaperone HscB [Chitinophagales bacterium]HNJ88327.1 Fe-S protein assembly co-chaperone HscB [Chitinophagales bacterium]HNM29836.1 Fe-S protein assembly co-chaperone HscB [Chitinophagales bacterium]
MTYFELFNIPVSFLPDETYIRQQYFALSKKYHPDFAATLPIDEQVQTLEHATLVNKAYQVLSNFERRMQYILQEKGIIEPEGKFNLPPDFLMEMMDLNEEAMQLKMQPDSGRVGQLQQRLQQQDTTLLEAIKPLLEHYNVQSATSDEYASIKEFYYKRRYILRLKEQINNFARS